MDRRRAELEATLDTMPADSQELEDELRDLWSVRLEIARQLTSSSPSTRNP